MKKIILVAASALLLCGISVSAQDKGDFFIGGTVGGSYANKVGTFDAQAEFGYFFIDNFRANLGIGYLHTGNSQDYRKTNDSFVLEPEVAYYFKIIDKLYYTPEFGINLGWGDSTIKYDEHSVHQPSFNWELYLNFASFEYKPSKHLGFTVGLGSVSVGGVNYSETELEAQRYEGSFGVSFLSTCSIGVKYYF